MIYYGKIDINPLGVIWIGVSSIGLKAVMIGGTESQFAALISRGGISPIPDDGKIAAASRQLQEYFSGSRRVFDLDLDIDQSTGFQIDALNAASQIPYGEVRTYGQLAQEIGRPLSAARAVGRAMATNPIPIVIPCHRVIGSDGSLRGYGGRGGIRTKAWLLRHEGYAAVEQLQLPWQQN
ncbi:MAG: methylated-DNA--[protein]-cysteine S-methyltransferase [Candidatus Promineifilaceae bacterium]